MMALWDTLVKTVTLWGNALAILMHVQKMVAASLLTFTAPHTLQVRVLQRLRLNRVTDQLNCFVQ